MPTNFTMNFRGALAQGAFAVLCISLVGYLDSLSRHISQSLLYGMVCLWAGYRLGLLGSGLVLVGCVLAHFFANLDYPQDLNYWVQSCSEAMLLAIVAYVGQVQRVSHDAVLATREEAAMAHSVLLEHLESARQVQADLLGAPPQGLEPYDLGLSFDVAVELGGDIYYVQQLPIGLFLFVGDVSGKGPRAALAATSVRILVESILRETPSPGQLLAELQLRFLPLFPGGLFVTAFCAVADPTRQCLVYANAGHDPALLRRAQQDRLEELAGQAMPVGIDAAESFPESTVIFSPGDRLLVYTDGLIDARQPDGGRLGSELVEQALLTFEGDGKELTQGLLELVPRPRHDDVMILALTFLPLTSSPGTAGSGCI